MTLSRLTCCCSLPVNPTVSSTSRLPSWMGKPFEKEFSVPLTSAFASYHIVRALRPLVNERALFCPRFDCDNTS